VDWGLGEKEGKAGGKGCEFFTGNRGTRRLEGATSMKGFDIGSEHHVAVSGGNGARTEYEGGRRRLPLEGKDGVISA